MPPVFSTFVDGTVMDPAAVAANFAAARAWLNDIPNADIVDGSIRREHLVRPMIRGFPWEGVEHTPGGGCQAAMGSSIGLLQPDVIADSEFSSLAQRLTIVPVVSNGVTRTIRTAVAKTFHVASDNYVSAVVTADMEIRQDPGAAIHPFDLGPGTQAVAGYFSLHFYNLSTNADSNNGARRFIYPMDQSNAGNLVHQAPLFVANSLRIQTPGFHEVQLCYHINAAASVIDQIDLARVMLHVEVL
ncbi:MAG TPA: hypothetical protein VI792_03250 [Candidatus Eisenbacteria bacterium]